MDFSNAGTTEPAGDGFRAHVQWYDKGAKRNRHIRGPRRPDEEAAKEDLEPMRAAANGMGREDGFAAMSVEADRLKAGKAPREDGTVREIDGGYRAELHWRHLGSLCSAPGPRRAEKRRAEEDLEAMREASESYEDPAARRAAWATEAQRLQQQAETERRVELFAHRKSQAHAQQQQQQPSVGQQQQQLQQQQQQRSVAQHPVEYDSDSQSDWEPGQADDADVVYDWEKFDERGRPLQ